LALSKEYGAKEFVLLRNSRFEIGRIGSKKETLTAEMFENAKRKSRRNRVFV
jgi:hypothetical protein